MSFDRTEDVRTLAQSVQGHILIGGNVRSPDGLESLACPITDEVTTSSVGVDFVAQLDRQLNCVRSLVFGDGGPYTDYVTDVISLPDDRMLVAGRVHRRIGLGLGCQPPCGDSRYPNAIVLLLASDWTCQWSVDFSSGTHPFGPGAFRRPLHCGGLR
ncbi:MAG: hypothetical protein AAFN74_16930 [Myxococcota bacterium]